MDPKSVDLSIVIINYNTFNLTCNCIHSIYNTAKDTNLEIILIDNASKECDPGLFLETFPNIKLIALPENVGFGRGNNIGMAESRGRYILLLNSDTIVLENTLQQCLNYLEEAIDVDILGCRSEYPGGHFQMTVFDYHGERSLPGAFKWMLKTNSLLRFLWDNFIRTNTDKYVPGKVYVAEPTSYEQIIPNYVNGHRIGSLMGVFLLFRRKVWEETKGFDPDFFMYWEETEWFINRLYRYNTVYYPKASIVHFQGKSDIYGKMKLQFHVSHYLFWYKLGALYFILFLLFKLIEIPSHLVLLLFKKDKKQIRFSLKNILKALPYAFFDIPFYSNKFDGRKGLLKIKFLKKRNL